MNRREFLQLAAMSSMSMLLPGVPGWAYSNGNDNPDQKKLIVIMLRGGIDGLNVVAPYADSNYHQIRPSIALSRPGTDFGALDLDGHFGLHPSLAPLMPLWQNKSLAFVHASGSPDPSRSHFDAQDYMETGIPGVKSVSTGWLNRLVAQIPKKESSLQAISLGATLPRIFAGPASVATIAKNIKPTKSVIDRPVIASVFQDLYNGKDDLSRAYIEGVAAHKEINDDLSHPDEPQMMDKEQAMANRGAPLPNQNTQFGKQLAQLIRKSPSIQVAFLDFGGWDTHVNEGSGKGQLANKLTPLGQGLADLVDGLGPLYKNTTIVVMSEFGRTAKENGNGGTDHGHGNVMWLMGGGLDGGKVFGRWAGLASNALHEQRDLPTSTDFRAVLSSLMNERLAVSKSVLANVFPEYQLSQNPWVQNG